MTGIPKEEPLWIESQAGWCFATLHRPERSSGRGVVICNTIGFEGQVAYRALRSLAETLAAQSYTVLRFDYPGSGDSERVAGQNGHVAAMRQGLDAAVAAMRGWGAREVYLAGIRVGATLATRYALDNGDISGLALWSPSVSGTGVVRELRARSRLSATGHALQKVADDDLPSDSLNVAGFEFSAAALDSLASLSILDDPVRPPAPRVLVLDREDSNPSTKLVQHLETAGVEIEHQIGGGWPEFMIDNEISSVLPTDSLRHITDWFSKLPPETVPTSTSSAPGPRLSRRLFLEARRDDRQKRGPAERNAIHEEPVRINNGVFGIKSMPVQSGAVSGGHGVIFLNTGKTNRTGPAGLYVNLARHLSGLGFKVLRVDLGGTGDTASSTDPLSSHCSPDRIDEVAQTVQWVRRNMNVDTVTLFGICSGAFHAFHSALEGAEVDQVIMVNPTVFYLGKDGSFQSAVGNAVGRAYGMKRLLFSPTDRLRDLDWERIRGRAPKALKGMAYLSLARARNVMPRFGSRTPRESLSADLLALTTRGVQVLLLFAPDEAALHYLKVFGGRRVESLQRSGAVHITELDEGDHLFSRRKSQGVLTDAVVEFLEILGADPAANAPSLMEAVSI